jgi:tetratricopeptide (TPR) repeat protein
MKIKFEISVEKICLAVLLILLISAAYLTFFTTPVYAGERAYLRQSKSQLLLGKTEEAMKSIEKHLERFPDDPEAYFTKGLIYHQEKNLPEAASWILKAAELEPTSQNYRLTLADIYNESGEIRKAAEVYQGIIDSGEEFEGIHEKLGEAYIRINRFQEAEIPLKKAIEQNPDSFNAYFLLGRSYQSRGFEDKAVEYYEEALKKGSEERTLYENLAHLQEDLGNIKRAIEINELLLRKNEALENKGLVLSNEERVKPYQALARLYRKNGDLHQSFKAWISYIFNGMSFETVVTFFIVFVGFMFVFSRAFKFLNYVAIFPLVLIAGALRQVTWLKTLSQLSVIYGLDYLVFLCNYEILSVDPKDSEAWYNLGVYYDKKNLRDKAKRNYLQAVELNPEMPEAWFMLATVQQRNKEYKKSEISLKKAMEFDSDNFMYWYHLSVAYFNQEMYPEAIEASKHSLEMSDKFPPTLELFVESCEFGGQMDYCFNFLRSLSIKKPKNVKLLMEAGNVLLTSGRAEESLKYFEETLTLSPKSYESWYNFGVAQRELEIMDKAMTSIKRAVDMEPGMAWLHTSYGLTLVKNNQKREAEKVLIKALDLEPMSSYTHYLLGLVMQERFPKRARIHLDSAIKLFTAEMSDLKKPWYKANEYECIAIAHELLGRRQESTEAYRNAIKYATVTPEAVWIFSEKKLGLVKPEDFITECENKLELMNISELASEKPEPLPEVQIEEPDDITS